MTGALVCSLALRFGGKKYSHSWFWCIPLKWDWNGALEKSRHPLGPSVHRVCLGWAHGSPGALGQARRGRLCGGEANPGREQPSQAAEVRLQSISGPAVGTAERFLLPTRHSMCVQRKDKLLLRIRAARVTLQVDFAATAAGAFLSL